MIIIVNRYANASGKNLLLMNYRNRSGEKKDDLLTIRDAQKALCLLFTLPAWLREKCLAWLPVPEMLQSWREKFFVKQQF